MKLVKRKYEHFTNIDTNVTLDDFEEYNIHVVYFIDCTLNENYLEWLINQIKIISNYNATIYIVSTVHKDQEESIKKSIDLHFQTLDITLEFYYKNEFEYRGILKVWLLGQKYNKKNDIILYFHSKGITHHKHYEAVKNDHYNIILNDINKIKEIFDVFQSIDKIGYSVGGNGWVWYNFWFARGSYINSVEKPIVTNRRYYYEDWLGRKLTNSVYKNTKRNCYGFHTDKINIANIGSYYNPNDMEYYNIETNTLCSPIAIHKKKMDLIRKKKELFRKKAEFFKSN